MDLQVTGNCTGIAVASNLRGSSDPEASTIDLRRLTWCDASGLVGITCLVQHLIEGTRAVRVVGPTNVEVGRYLARMRLGSVLSALGASHDLPLVHEHASTTLVELSEFDGAAGATELANMAYDHVVGADPLLADALFTGLAETAENVHEHSGRVSGFAAAQRYSDGRLTFSVGDSGIGMLGSLSKVGVTTHEQALRVGLRRGGTGSGDIGRGHGLPSVVDHTCAQGGQLTVISGDAALTIRADQRPASSSSSKAFPGTLIAGVIPR